MFINHTAIIRQYQTDPDAHRRLQSDAVLRMEQEQRAGNFAAELRAMAPKPINKTLYPGIKRCKHCGSRNVKTFEKHLVCNLCSRQTWRWP